MTPFAQAYVVTPWTDAIAHVSGELMRAFDSSITTRGNVIGSQTSPFAVSIEAGCNGLEATLVPIAAIAFAYQFGSLMLQAVVPAVLWVALHGAFITRLRGRRASVVA